MKKLSVSVAMCTYNGARFLRQQLSSIADQSLQPDELVASDDGSTDETLGILDEFASHVDFPVRILVNTRRLGPAKNFEKAIDACQGDVIVLADQDDVWFDRKLIMLVQAFEEHPDAAYVFCDAGMIDESGNSLGESLWTAVNLRDRLHSFAGQGQLIVLLRHNVIPGAALAFRANIRDIILPIPAGWMHDYWIVLLGSIISYGVPVHEQLFAYRRHPNQACGWRKKSFRQVWMDSFTTTSEDSWRKLEVFRLLLSRVRLLPDLDPLRDRVQMLREKETHLLNRAHARSASGITKVMGVLAEVKTGRYQRFSGSWYSILRDL